MCELIQDAPFVFGELMSVIHERADLENDRMLEQTGKMNLDQAIGTDQEKAAVKSRKRDSKSKMAAANSLLMQQGLIQR